MGIQINGQTDTISSGDGSLSVTGAELPSVTNLNISGVTTVSAGSASSPSITPSGDSNTGIFFPAADTIAFAEGGAEVLRINSSANVGIGTTNPGSKLDVNGEITIRRTSAGSEGGQVNFARASDNTVAWNIDAFGATSTPSLRFIDAIAGASRADIDSSGNFTVSSGNIVIGTSGKGIDFSATANGSGTTGSELLSDYEEGTWTPTLGGTSSNPTGVSYISQNASYIKVGRKVTCRFYFAFTTFTGGTGTPCIGGLPFASGSAANTYSEFALPYVTVVTYPAGTTSLGLELAPNDTKLAIFGVGSELSGYQTLAFGTHISSSANGKLLLAVITYFTD